MLSIKIPGGAAVKSTVKASLSDKYAAATVAAMSVVFAFMFLFMMTSAVATVFEDLVLLWVIVAVMLCILVINPILLGAVRWFWRATEGGNEGPETVFYYFSSFFRYARSIKCILYLCYKLGGIFLVCLLPYLIVTLLSNSWIYQFLGTEVPLWAAGLVLVQAFLRIAGVFVALAISTRYYLVLAVVVMDDNSLILESAHISSMVSRHSSGALVGLIAALFFWILLSFLVLPLLYTAPLILGCYVVHSRYALVNYNMNLEYYTEGKYGE